MALAIDGSTPAVFTSTSGTATSASFNPPAGSILLVFFSGNSNSGANPSAPTITDNLGAHLTYTRHVWRSRADGSPVVNGHAAVWTASVTTGGSMTVSVTQAISELACTVIVLTGQHSSTPVGAIGGAGSASASSISQSYTAQATGGWGFIGVCDWDALGSMSIGGSCTMIGTGDVGSGQISYGFGRRTSADDSNGASNSLNINPNGTSTNLQWVWLEILPEPASQELPGEPVRNIPNWLLLELLMRQTRLDLSIPPPIEQLVDQVVGTDSAQPITSNKAKLTGQITESDSAQALTSKKTVILGQASESSAAGAITPSLSGGGHTVAIGQVTETSTSQTVSRLKTKAIGQASETSTVQTITPRKSSVLGLASESSTAQALTRLKTKTIGQITETDTAQTVSRLKSKAIGQASESDATRTVTPVKSVTLGRASESDTAQAVAHSKVKAIGQVTETSTANPVTVQGAPIIVGMVTESSEAQSISVRKTKAVSQALESGAANVVSRIKTKSVAQASESNLAQSIVRYVVPLIVQVNESDTTRQVAGGTAAADTHGWRPLVGLHCIYLQQKTFGGNTNYVKRIPVIITGFATDGYPILKNKHTGVSYGTASIGVRPRSHPDADEVEVYVSY